MISKGLRQPSAVLSVLFSSASLMMSSCQAGDRTRSGESNALTLHFDTLISTESGRVGQVGGLAVDSAGQLWLSDAINNHLLVISPEGESVRTIGRTGQGPAEFRNPAGLGIGLSEVYVCDVDNGRLQRLSLSGEYLGVVTLAAALYLPVSVNSQGDVAVMTLGRAGRLVEVVTASGGRSRLLGEAIDMMPSQISAQSLREQALRGEMPREFRNMVLPALGSGGELWAVGLADGRVQLFSGNDMLVWTNSLPLAELDAAQRAYYAAWQTKPNGFHVPIVARAAKEVGRELWVLMDSADSVGSVIVALAKSDGHAARRMELPLGSRAGDFAVDPSHRRLYLSLPDEAAILRVAVPKHMVPR